MTRLQRSGLRAVAIVWACSVAAQLPPMPDIPRVAPPALPADGHYKVVIPNRPDPVPVVLHVSPAGSDEGDGSAASPFASLMRAQQAVRTLNRDHDVTLSLAAGVYRLEAPLRFTARDGGQNGYTVRWEGAPGMDTMLSGGTPVTGWGLVDSQRNIWSARVPASMDPRQLSVGGRPAQRASVEIPRSSVAFHPWGIEIKDPAWRFLANLPDQSRLKVEDISWFTHLHAMVDRIEGDRTVMPQPGWRNNLVGYDTVAKPVSVEVARMFLVNALAFLRDPGQWFIDPKAGRLYYKPLPNEEMNRIAVVVPRLERLVSIAGTYDDPFCDLEFRRLHFSHTSWLRPSGPGGIPASRAARISPASLSITRPIPSAIADGGAGRSSGCAIAGTSSRQPYRLQPRGASSSTKIGFRNWARSRWASATTRMPTIAVSASALRQSR